MSTLCASIVHRVDSKDLNCGETMGEIVEHGEIEQKRKINKHLYFHRTGI